MLRCVLFSTTLNQTFPLNWLWCTKHSAAEKSCQQLNMARELLLRCVLRQTCLTRPNVWVPQRPQRGWLLSKFSSRTAHSLFSGLGGPHANLVEILHHRSKPTKWYLQKAFRKEFSRPIRCLERHANNSKHPLHLPTIVYQIQTAEHRWGAFVPCALFPATTFVSDRRAVDVRWFHWTSSHAFPNSSEPSCANPCGLPSKVYSW